MKNAAALAVSITVGLVLLCFGCLDVATKHEKSGDNSGSPSWVAVTKADCLGAPRQRRDRESMAALGTYRAHEQSALQGMIDSLLREGSLVEVHKGTALRINRQAILSSGFMIYEAEDSAGRQYMIEGLCAPK